MKAILSIHFNLIGALRYGIEVMRFRIVSALLVVSIFGCSTWGGNVALPIRVPFPYQCSGPYLGKEISEEVLLKVRIAHETWLKDPKDPQGQQANFCKAQLSSGKFQHADLTFAVFQMAMLAGANFTGAQLNEAQLQGANLSGANFSQAQLIGVRFDDAMLHLAIFSQARFGEKTSFRDAMLYKVQFKDVDLRKIEGLTQSQINMACLDSSTILPHGLSRPGPCSGRTQN